MLGRISLFSTMQIKQYFSLGYIFEKSFWEGMKGVLLGLWKRSIIWSKVNGVIEFETYLQSRSAMGEGMTCSIQFLGHKKDEQDVLGRQILPKTKCTECPDFCKNWNWMPCKVVGSLLLAILKRRKMGSFSEDVIQRDVSKQFTFINSFSEILI